MDAEPMRCVHLCAPEDCICGDTRKLVEADAERDNADDGVGDEAEDWWDELRVMLIRLMREEIGDVDAILDRIAKEQRSEFVNSDALEVLCRVFEDGADGAFEEWRAWYDPARWLHPARALGAFIYARQHRDPSSATPPSAPTLKSDLSVADYNPFASWDTGLLVERVREIAAGTYAGEAANVSLTLTAVADRLHALYYASPRDVRVLEHAVFSVATDLAEARAERDSALRERDEARAKRDKWHDEWAKISLNRDYWRALARAAVRGQTPHTPKNP